MDGIREQGPNTSGNPPSNVQGNDAGDIITSLLGTQTPETPGAVPQALPATGQPQGTSQQTASPEGSPPQGTTAPQLPGWTAAATKELRADPRFTAYAAKFKSLDEAVKSALELESKMGAMVSIPGEDATPEEIAAFWKKAGVPESKTDYKLDKGTLSDADYNAFLETAHSAGMPQPVAAKLLDWYKGRATEYAAQQEAQRAQELAARKTAKVEAERVLKERLGADYQTAQDTMRRAVSQHMTPALAKKLSDSGLGNDPDLALILYHLGKTLNEDTSVRGEGPGASQGGTWFSYD